MRFCILSAHLLGEPEYVNKERFIALQHALDQASVPYKLVGGNLLDGYEYGVLVPAGAESLVQDLCAEFNQDCYLRRELDNTVFRCYTDGTEQYLGVWTELSTPVTASPRNGFIQDLETGQCYTAEGF